MKRLFALLVLLALLIACKPVEETKAVPAPTVEPVVEATPEPVVEPVTEPVPEAESVATPLPASEPVVETAPVEGRVIEISIEKMAFSEETVTIKKGDTVVWTNKDGTPHSVTVTQGPAPDKFDSNVLRQGQSFSHKFDIVNTYYYKCSLHPVMRGKIIVEP